jgi:hypothetical protein
MGQLVSIKIFHFQNYIEWNMIIKYPRLLNFNELIKKHEILQDTTFKGLPKNVIPIISISKNLQFEYLYKNQILPKLLINYSLSTNTCFHFLFN